MKFEVIQGDVAEQSADALVNAAGTSLEMGSGVAGALRDAANGPINEAAVAEAPVDLGGVAVTDAFDLDAEYVIHAAAMPHDGDGEATVESVRDATRNALERADELGCWSVVIPVLGTGTAGLPFDEGARAVCEEIAAFEPAALANVRVIAYADDEHAALSRIADEVQND